LDQVITWLIGYSDGRLQNLINKKVTFETFFGQASLHPNAPLVRYLDKSIDELAKGKKTEKILRS
jgi:hypothetical protein